jgi:alkylresorcinol/alkylpyrone synthase
VVAALEESLGLGEGALDHERAVLRDYGNMSAPTGVFVLQRLLRFGMPERTMLLALGPGFHGKRIALSRP